MHEGKIVDHDGRKFPFPAEKHPFPRDQYVVEDDQRIGVDPNRPGVGEFQRADVGGEGTADLAYAFGIGRYGKGHRIVRIGLAHGPAGDGQDIVAIGGAGDVDLGAPYHDAFAVLLHHTNIEIRVGLLRV